MTIFKHQELLVVSLEGDYWAKVRSRPAGEEQYVPRAFINFLEPVSAVADEDQARPAYRNWVTQVERVLKDSGRAGDGSDERREREAELRKAGKLGEEERMGWTKIDFETFPFPPKEICSCEVDSCKVRKEEMSLGACKHDVERLLKGVGKDYNASWLWRESLKWHPDKWVRFLANDFVEGERCVTEMFVIIKGLADERREAEGNATGKRC